MDIIQFLAKVDGNDSKLEDWEEFLRVMDAYLKKGVRAIISDYRKNGEESDLHQYYEVLRKVFEDTKNYQLPKEIKQDSKLKNALKVVYEKCGDLIAQMEWEKPQDLTKAIGTLREKALLVQKELLKLMTVLAISSMVNLQILKPEKKSDYEVEIKSNNPKSNLWEQQN